MSPDPSADEPCAVSGCAEPSLRHLASSEARKAFPQLAERRARVALCRTHYRQWKKATKVERTLARLGR